MSRDTQPSEGQGKTDKNSVPVDVLSKFDCSKKDNTSKCIAKEEEEHANDDEEALVHADYYSQQQHLQSHLLSITQVHVICKKNNSPIHTIFIIIIISHQNILTCFPHIVKNLKTITHVPII